MQYSNCLSFHSLFCFRYHSDACYKVYLLRAERHKEKETEINSKIDEKVAENDSIIHSTPRLKRRKSDDSVEQKCIICNKQYHNKITKMFRLCEEERAELFMKATKFNLDAVLTRTCIYNSKEKLFAADIYSHAQCMNKHLLQYKRDMQVETENSPQDYSENIQKEFDTFVKTLELHKKSYTVSFRRDAMNAKLDENKLNNKQVKQLLIEFYGEEICFTYPKDKSKPQMFFSSSIRQTDIVETLRVKNSIAECAQKLRDECENSSFNLDDSNCNARDIANSLNQYKLEKPPLWEMFFNNLFPQRSRYENLIIESVTPYFTLSLILYIIAEKRFH